MAPSSFEIFYETRKILIGNKPVPENFDYCAWLKEELKLYWDTAQQSLIENSSRDYDREEQLSATIADLEDKLEELRSRLKDIHSLSEEF